MPVPVPAEFDPEQDLPPDGATVAVAVAKGERVRFDAGPGWWIVTSGPYTGAIAWPFSPEGIAMARVWWRRERQTGRSD